MTSIPDHPKEQLLFFIDNPLVAAEPGGNAVIGGFLALVAPVIGGGGHGGASSTMAALFDSELFSASTPAEGEPAGDSGKGGGNHGDDAGAAIGLVLGLGGLARGDLDI